MLELSPTSNAERVDGYLGELVHKRFIRPDPLALGGGFRFQHALIRDAVYKGDAKGMRADLHERMAARLEQRHALAALIGYHLERAFLLRRELGHTETALAIRSAGRLREAGEDAFARSDVPAAVRLFERVLGLLPPEDRSRPDLLIELGYAKLKLGEVQAAEGLLVEAIDRARALGDRAAELHALLDRQFLRSVTASEPTAEESMALARQVIPELERLGADLALVRAHWLQSEGDAFGCRWLQRAEALERALEHARRGDRAAGDRDALRPPRAGAVVRRTAVTISPRGSSACSTRWGRIDALQATVGTNLAWLLAMQGAGTGRALYARAVATYIELEPPVRACPRTRSSAPRSKLTAGDPAAAERSRARRRSPRRLGHQGAGRDDRGGRADVLCTLGR